MASPRRAIFGSMSTTGRAEELQRLRAHVLERRAVLVVGPPGAGRSQLLEALAGQLTESGTEHCLVRGADGEAGLPLVAFAPLLARSKRLKETHLPLYKLLKYSVNTLLLAIVAITVFAGIQLVEEGLSLLL